MSPDHPQSLNLHQRPHSSSSHVRITKREAQSLGDNHASAEFTITDYLAEERFSEHRVNTLCAIGAEPTSRALQQRREPSINAMSSAPSPIVTQIRRNGAPLSDARHPVLTPARCRTVGESLQECDERGHGATNRQSLTTQQRQHSGQLLRKEAPTLEFENGGLSCSTAWHLELRGKTHTVASPNTGKRTFEFEECGLSLSNGKTLRQHRRTHTDKYPFVYTDCGIRFVKRRNPRLHTDGCPFVCSDCGKRYVRKHSLTRHRLLHTGERPFVCSDCGQRFRQMVHLTTHRSARHTDE